MFFNFLAHLIHWLQPILVPVCFIVAWALILMTVWRVFEATRDTVKQAKQMHQIPCPDCEFFTGDYNLKCPVHPTTALSEDAIECPDYYSKR
ncbi:MAG: hypothetical protein C4288_07650 [Leptolyngbya sp. ERB_1_1]